MFERFTDRARSVLVVGQSEARASSAPAITTGHLLAGMAADPVGVSGKVLEQAGLSIDEIRRRSADHIEVVGDQRRAVPDARASLSAIGVDLDSVVRQAESAFGEGALGPGGGPPYGELARDVLEHALHLALSWGHDYVGTEHLLGAVALDPRSVAAGILAARGMSASSVQRAAVEALLSYGLPLAEPLEPLAPLRVWAESLDAQHQPMARQRLAELERRAAEEFVLSGSTATDAFLIEVHSSAAQLAAALPGGVASLPPAGSLVATLRVWFSEELRALEPDERMRHRDIADDFDTAVGAARETLRTSAAATRQRVIPMLIAATINDLRTEGLDPPGSL